MACRHLEIEETNRRFQPATLPSSEIDISAWSADHLEELKQAVATTLGVVGSSEFQRQVTSLKRIHVAVGGREISGGELRALYLYGRLPTRFVPSLKADETAHTGPCGDHAEVHFGSDNMKRWQPGSAELQILGRSCVVNTISHEWIHTIPDMRGGALFADAGHSAYLEPLASYTIGSIAQCQYLQDSLPVSRAGKTDRWFWDCVHAVGTTTFRAVCDDLRWLPSP